MSELKVYLSNALSDRFRRIAMSVYGYGRGSLSKAAEDAFSKWCEQHEQPSSKSNVPGPAGPSTEAPQINATHIDPEERPSTDADADSSGTPA